MMSPFILSFSGNTELHVCTFFLNSGFLTGKCTQVVQFSATASLSTKLVKYVVLNCTICVLLLVRKLEFRKNALTCNTESIIPYIQKTDSHNESRFFVFSFISPKKNSVKIKIPRTNFQPNSSGGNKTAN